MLKLGSRPGSHCDIQAPLSSQTIKLLFSHLNGSVTDTTSPLRSVVPRGLTQLHAKQIFMLPHIKTHSRNFIGNVNSFVCISMLDFNLCLDSYNRVSELRTVHGGCKSSVVIFVAVLRCHYLATRAAFVSMSVSSLSADLWSGQV